MLTSVSPVTLHNSSGLGTVEKTQSPTQAPQSLQSSTTELGSEFSVSGTTGFSLFSDTPFGFEVELEELRSSRVAVSGSKSIVSEPLEASPDLSLQSTI